MDEKQYARRPRAISLMYHDVCDDPDSSGFNGADAALYKITPAEFSDHLKAIDEAETVKPTRVTDWNGIDAAVFITFDDGGGSAMRAADMLEEYGWRGHFLITTGQISAGTFVSKSEIAELHRRGHIVGSHSDSHPLRMSGLNESEIAEEWRVSTEKLGDILTEKVKVASVPGGGYSNEVADCAGMNGIEFLFNSEPTTNVSRIGNCTILGRYAVQSRSGADWVGSVVNGDWLPRFRQQLFWNVKKPLKKIGGESFLHVRRAIINRTQTGKGK